MPEARRIPPADTSGRPFDPQERLDPLEAAAQPAPSANMQEIAVVEIALEIGVQSLANNRQIEAAAVECHDRSDTVECGVERHIAYAAADELDRAAVRPIDADHADRAVERGFNIEVGANSGAF